MNWSNDPLMDNYYALYLAIIYPCFLTADEALYAIRHGISPIVITEQTVVDAFSLAQQKKEPAHYDEYCGRRYEIVKMFSEIFQETNVVMEKLKDYELEKYRKSVINYMKYLRERTEKERIR